MNAKMKQLITTSLLTGLVVVWVVFINSCKKSEPAAPSSAPAATTQGHERHEHAAASTETAKENVAAAEQTTCPIMGGTIDKNIFTEYKGKKVYFCCAGCKEQFEKEPEKYIALLPQFKQ